MSNLIIDTPSRHVYIGDGSTRVFPIPTPIEGDDWIRIEINGIHIIDRRQWDIVNNSIIFVTAPEAEATIDVLVASSIEAMTQLGSTSAIDVVAENITNVNLVSQNIEDVVNVSNNLDIVSTGFEEVKVVAENILDVNTVAENIGNINIVAEDMPTINENIGAIIGASDNAITTIKNKYLAEAEALTSKSYAVEGENLQVKKFISNGDGTFSEHLTGDFSSYHYSLKAKTSELNVTNKVNEISIIADEVVDNKDIIEDIKQNIIEKAQEAIKASEEAKQSALIAGAFNNIEWTGFTVIDGELNVSYIDGITSTPTLVDGDFIITY